MEIAYYCRTTLSSLLFRCDQRRRINLKAAMRVSRDIRGSLDALDLTVAAQQKAAAFIFASLFSPIEQ